MWFTLKSRWTQLAVLLLAATSALQAVVGTPLDFDTDAPSFAVERATGKYVGATCSANDECFSKNCQLVNGTQKKTCQRQPFNGPCFQNNNCLSRKCSQGKCAASPLNGECNSVSDCANASSKVCSGGKCNARTTALLAPNSACSADGDCVSGHCESLRSCFDSTGLEGSCSPGALHCTRLPLGSTCANDGDCAEGFCRSGVCSTSRTGDACVSETQCVGTSICGTTGQCHTPSRRSLYPQDVCGSNTQCKSGRCVKDLLITDQLDTAFPYAGTGRTPYTQPTMCDYFRLGEPLCRDYVDCGPTGTCINGVCALGAQYDPCLLNQHCADICGLDGFCIPQQPAGSIEVGDPCTANSTCQTNRCELGFIYRPLPNVQPVTYQYVQDTVCVKARIDGPCQFDAQCEVGACRNGVCTQLNIGDSCSSYNECVTFRCTAGICELASTHTYCSLSSQCYSNACKPIYCAPGTPNCDPHTWCDPVPVLGTCRDDSDCDSVFDSVTCDLRDNTCRYRTNHACSSGVECLSGICAAGKCS
ncbi:hypothetical protein OC842_006451 [Tilletia horrida]|uniref:Dickkopf N-terminal cysteine-rich domain-containing protein n=1 Tax=Tilletia horrida TaxID=155126 RepID=A0AAN6GA77_9BASI|nr:hypothetical protein OC842_006451 [Tilletia horrida]